MAQSISSSGRPRLPVRSPFPTTRHVMCRVSVPSGAGGLIFAVFSWFLIAALVYFIAGFVYNMVVNNRSGTEAIPHHEFWSEVFGFLGELFSNIKNRLPGRGGGYQQI